MRPILIVLSILVSAVLTYYAYFFTPIFVKLVGRSFSKLFDLHFGYWSLQHIVFALTFGIIPVVSLIPWMVSQDKNLRSLFVFNLLATFLIITFISGTAIWIIVSSPRRAFNTIKQPHEDFWNYVFIASVLFAVLVLSIFSIVTRKRRSLKDSNKDRPSPLDQ